MGWFLSGPADQVLIVLGVFLHLFLSVFVSCVLLAYTTTCTLGGYLKEKPHEEDIDEIIHRKFAGTVSARMLVADGGAVGFKIARMNRRVQSSSPSARRRRCQ